MAAKRAPNLRAADRIIAGLCTLFIRRQRVPRSVVVLKPVLVVMDQFTRRIIGLASTAAPLTASRCAGCSKERLVGKVCPKCLSSDHDRLYRFHQWQANLRALVADISNTAHESEVVVSGA